MLTKEMITQAYHRLLGQLGDEHEKRATERNRPDQLPTEADLISRAVNDDIDHPAADPADLLAALQLTAQDQSNAESREVNVVSRLRSKDVSWRVIAQYRGLESPQAARQRYERLARRSPAAHQAGTPDTMIVEDTLVYAFRIAGEEDATWHGEPELMPAEPYETVPFSFVPDLPRPPFSGRTLEFRVGRVRAEVLPGHLRAYPLVGNRRIGMTAATQQALLGA